MKYDEAASALALTQGDPSGIGPELALLTWRKAQGDPSLPPFFYIGDPDHLARRAYEAGIETPLVVTTPADAGSRFRVALPVVPTGLAVQGLAGRPDSADAAGTIRAIEMAVAFVRDGEAPALVTNPIAKHVLQGAGFAYSGHTEFLAALAQTDAAHPVRPVMMLWSDALAVVPVTIHVALARVPTLLTRALIVDTATIVVADMKRRFGLHAPRLAISGLNPHAGERGTMGREEIETIAPAVTELVAMGIDARGPLPADTMFHAAARARYDVALCMTHDQALIPIKTLAFDSAVNVTLGLPFVRTSPDHGTAFDIAGKGIADPSSLIAALRLAAQLAKAGTRR
jgi:4-hydroxythreonine-4-phosphate dehydrogenase